MNKRDTIKLGVVGCGQVAEHKHLLVLQHVPGVEVVAVADRDATRLQIVAERYRVPRRYQDFRELLAQPDIDAVGLCVPASAHAEVGLAAIAAHKHVLIEKPLALSLSDCESICAGAQDAKGQVMVGFHMRWHRLVRQARVLLQQGLLGPIEAILTVWNSPIRYDGSLASWRYTREAGGGALVEIAVHHFDLWRFLLQSEVQEIFAMSCFDKYADETATVTARMDNNVLASGVFSERTSHEIEIEIYGREGRLRISCSRFDGLEFYPANGLPGGARTRLRQALQGLKELPHALFNRLPGGEYMASYRYEWQHFIDSIRHDTPVAVTPEDGLRAQQIVLAATESVALGQPVKIKQAPRELAPLKLQSV